MSPDFDHCLNWWFTANVVVINSKRKPSWQSNNITYIIIIVSFYCAFGQYNIIVAVLQFFFHTDKPVFLSHMEGDPVDLYVFESDSVNLTCQNSAEPAANMSWSFNEKYFVNPADHYIVRIILHNLCVIIVCYHGPAVRYMWQEKHNTPYFVVSRTYTRKCVRHVIYRWCFRVKWAPAEV